uniref:Uncharacterized protein n=1 Tax=Rhizophora mucronata TaxID=61149 RepID=A0A2P2ITR5_RHIMU
MLRVKSYRRGKTKAHPHTQTHHHLSAVRYSLMLSLFFLLLTLLLL